MSASDLLINFLGAVVAATALRQVVKTAYESPAWHFRLGGVQSLSTPVIGLALQAVSRGARCGLECPY